MKLKIVALAASAFAVGFGLMTCDLAGFLPGLFAGGAAVCAWEIYLDDEDDENVNDADKTV